MEDFRGEIARSLDYLNSSGAQESLRCDLYWPKWDSPWWHCLCLHEMGLSGEIPARVLDAIVKGLVDFPLQTFPIQPQDLPAGLDPRRQTQCHCALGNIYQLLCAAGVEVDRCIPWIRPWFLRYQMEDGGLNCDNSAYLVEGQSPSSMVGTIAAFEAVVRFTWRPFTSQEAAWVERAAQFLLDRRLVLGSSTEHNREEREQAQVWGQLCFPRFYFYDVLRGCEALHDWSLRCQRQLPEWFFPLVRSLQPTPQRRPWQGARTLVVGSDQNWHGENATSFPLLEAVSRLDRPSPFLEARWRRIVGALAPPSPGE